MNQLQLPACGKPISLHITLAAYSSHPSSQTVVHAPLTHTSTRPSESLAPPANLTVPSIQPTQKFKNQ